MTALSVHWQYLTLDIFGPKVRMASGNKLHYFRLTKCLDNVALLSINALNYKLLPESNSQTGASNDLR